MSHSFAEYAAVSTLIVYLTRNWETEDLPKAVAIIHRCRLKWRNDLISSCSCSCSRFLYGSFQNGFLYQCCLYFGKSMIELTGILHLHEVWKKNQGVTSYFQKSKCYFWKYKINYWFIFCLERSRIIICSSRVKKDW